MKSEGMGRRASRRDVERDLQQQELDAVDAAFDRMKAEVVSDLLSIDQEGKALTGRKIDQYEDESGIAEDELFPENARILNIGDPWQVLDKEGMVNLEYEAGEEADFVLDQEVFQDSILPELDRMERLIEEIQSGDDAFGSELKWRVNAVKERLSEGVNIEDYPKESAVMYDVTRLISTRHGNDDGHGASRELWYAAMRLARGLEDVYYAETVIKPAVERAVIEERGLSKEDEAVLIRQLIEEFRGRKKYKHAELVKGAFPDTSFEDDSFDRVTASWSVSAHMFGVMDEKQFAVVWKELDRILKRDGAAYIWPLDYQSGSGGEMAKSLIDYIDSGGNAGFITWDSDGPYVEWIEDVEEEEVLAQDLTTAQTLVFLPRGAKRHEVKRRVEQSLVQIPENAGQDAA